jgi:hypothetical protein
MQTAKPVEKSAGFRTVVGAFLYHLFLGNIYLWGGISVYVESYFHHRYQDKNANDKMSAAVLPITLLTNSFTLPIGAYLYKIYHPKLIMTVTSSIMLSAFFLQTLVTRWWTFVFLQAVVFPAGIGLSYFTPIICCWE